MPVPILAPVNIKIHNPSLALPVLRPLAILLCLWCSLGSARANSTESGREPYIVQISTSASAAAPRSLASLPRPLSGDQWRISATPEQIAHWQAQGFLLHAEPDRRVLPQRIPADPLFFNQWNLGFASNHGGAANLQRAWQEQTGDVETVVAVIDTGVLLTHQDIASRMLPGYDFVSDKVGAADGDARDADPTDPGDWVDAQDAKDGTYGDNCLVQDSTWHGTAVSGILAATSNNQTGIAGGTWSTQILPVRALGKCGGHLSDLVDAIRWSAGLKVPGVPNNPHPADIINLSVGMQGHCSVAEQSAINDAVAAGSMVVVAAGNGGQFIDQNPSSPASCQNVLAVAAVTANGQRADYSNYGSAIHLSAPGGNTQQGILTSFDSGKQDAHHDHHYSYITGTSMAAPHVSATLALLMAQYPSDTPKELRQRLLQNTRRFTQSCHGCGVGLLDAYRALTGLTADGGAPPTSGQSPSGGGGGGALLWSWLMLLFGLVWRRR